MLSAKRHLIDDSTWEARPIKRQAQYIKDHGKLTQSTKYLSLAGAKGDSKPGYLAQSIPQSLSDFNRVASCPSFLGVSEPVDEVCFGMVA